MEYSIWSLGQVHFEELCLCTLCCNYYRIFKLLLLKYWFLPVIFRSACSNHNVYEKTLL